MKPLSLRVYNGDIHIVRDQKSGTCDIVRDKTKFKAKVKNEIETN